ncbi:hypothetical protein ABEB36_001425 [Hypothenemus hampei]|uniref:Nucleoprotein TPR n=1 Tax=Hypothenemus hampei TaxID=57062 RepID=A0ABD1FEL3_HYPHA
MKATLEYKEKRLEQDRGLLNSQIETLSEELHQRTEELLNMRRDNSSRCIQLEIKLSEKTEELTVANEQIKSLMEFNQNLTTRNEELAQKLFNQNETHSKVNESFVCEIEAKSKMANTYKTMHEESTKYTEELKNALSEVQGLLKNATEQYGELETNFKESELAKEEIINKKNECIAMLKKELETANDVIEHCKNESLGRDLEGISTSAASMSRMMKSGMSYTELYSRYVSVTEQLTSKEEECARLNNHITSIIREIEEKGPLFKQLKQEYSDALDANEMLKSSNDSLLAELQQLRDSIMENRKIENQVARENQRMKKEVADLSRQVVHLLQEVEHSRIGSSSTSTDNDLSDSVSSADIITKRLVTFNDISELQATNQKLLALVRELTEKQEEVEAFDPATVANLQRKLEDLRESQNELLEERDQQTKMMVTLRNQRDMYKNLYTQATKGAGDIVLPTERGNNLNGADLGENSKVPSDTESNTIFDEKLHDLEAQVTKYKKQVEHMKEEYETYRTERLEHEKILLEQLETVRNECKDLTKMNGKLSSQAELNEEKFKTMQNNAEIYRKQIVALEKQNSIYSEAIVKHEQAASYLKDEAIQGQTRASRAEVILANVEKENSLLKDAERRLLKECEMLKQHSHQQTMLQSNIELIKAILERNNAESKLRLEAKLDEAHLECASLRRRLEEEQKHFRELSQHLEKQTKLAEQRMEEEKLEADKLRKEITEAREELINKTTQLDDLSKKLKSSVFSIPDTTIEGKKLRELEQRYLDAQSEINALKSKLRSTKEASEEYFNIAQNAEKQLKEVLEQEQKYQEEIEQQKKLVKELLEKNDELQGELSIHMDDQDISNASNKNKSHELQEELNVRNLDLHSARQQLALVHSDLRTVNEQLKIAENKYAREVTLHSIDLQALSDLKIKLDETVSKVKDCEAERDQAVEALQQHLLSAQEQQKILNDEKEKLEERFKDMDEQNSLLLDQIQQLNTQLTILQTQVSADNINMSQQADSSFNRSLAEDEVHGSEQLLKIIKYLRQEKDIAVSKADIIEAEHFRLKSQFETTSKQLEEAQAQIEAERQKAEVTSISAAKHAEVLRKLETLNAITDSNRALRQERDQLQSEITELRIRAEKLESEMAPLQERNRDLMTKADQMQTENISLRSECNRWRQRANLLIEKTNRTSPEDWKKLQTERETLAKQLTVERGNTAKLTDENNNLRQNQQRLEEQLKALRVQNNNQSEEIARLREQVSGLQSQVTQLSETVEQQNQQNAKITEENRILTEDVTSKNHSISELKNNLTQVKKIAKKYKTQCEDQVKDIESLRQQNEQTQIEQNQNTEKQNQLLEQQTFEHQVRVRELETTHRESVDQLTQQVSSGQEQIDALKREIETVRQTSQDKEEKFKTLFKNAKERIVSLTEQNNSLKEELTKQDKEGSGGEHSGASTSTNNGELMERINSLQQEKDELIEKLQQEKVTHASEIEALKLAISQLERKLGQQQGSKPSTISASSEKSPSERPTADIKPIPGTSTNTQTQSVPIQPWRSVGEPPLASIRPMSQQLRTAAVLPTTQTPSAVMIPPQQQVHTTGSSSIEALSSSPTSSHTDYVPATSSAGSSMLGPRQVAVPPTQSSEDDDGTMQVQLAPQQQTLAVVSPRVEPPSSGSATQEQGTSSSSSSNTVTTTQAGLKRQRDADTDSCQPGENSPAKQQSKRTRLQQAGISESGLEVEYQVPTSSQRDQDDDNVIVVESDDDAGPDEGEGDDQEEPDDTEAYDMEGLEQDNYEDADCQDVEDEEEPGNEVEIIDDSSEVPNQSESQEGGDLGGLDQQSEAISSGTDGTGRSVPTTPLQSSPQESIPNVADEPSDRQTTQSDEEIPQILISQDDETRGEGSSEEVMGPPSQAGTSSEDPRQTEEAEGDDGVSSEGEKQPSTEEGEEEGREAEASQSPNEVRRVLRTVTRRSVRINPARGSRMGPTPIIWGDQQHSPQRQSPQQDRGRGGAVSYGGARGAPRRSRGRMPRPYNRF